MDVLNYNDIKGLYSERFSKKVLIYDSIDFNIEKLFNFRNYILDWLFFKSELYIDGLSLLDYFNKNYRKTLFPKMIKYLKIDDNDILFEDVKELNLFNLKDILSNEELCKIFIKSENKYLYEILLENKVKEIESDKYGNSTLIEKCKREIESICFGIFCFPLIPIAWGSIPILTPGYFIIALILYLILVFLIIQIVYQWVFTIFMHEYGLKFYLKEDHLNVKLLNPYKISKGLDDKIEIDASEILTAYSYRRYIDDLLRKSSSRLLKV